MTSAQPHALVLGASRGLGLVLVDELLRRGWRVTATARTDTGELYDRVAGANGALRVERLELTDPADLAALRDGLAGDVLDLLFVNAAVDRGNLPICHVPVDMFTEVMVTNALAPLRAVEALRDLVSATGTIAIMSSEQGSISRNTEPGFELYKASKAALNQLLRSYATRSTGDGRTLLLIDPGHNQTRLGGWDAAPLRPAKSIPAVVDVLERNAGAGGLQFLDRFGEPVPW